MLTDIVGLSQPTTIVHLGYFVNVSGVDQHTGIDIGRVDPLAGEIARKETRGDRLKRKSVTDEREEIR